MMEAGVVTRVRWGLSFVIGCLGAIRVAAKPVGDAGDLSRATVTGAVVIPASDVLDALREDAGFQLAATPTAPLDKLLDTVPARVRVAYLRAGFPEPRAAAREAGGRLAIEVTEGPRYVAGPVRVEVEPGRAAGQAKVDAARLTRFLTERAEPAQFPLKVLPDGFQVVSDGKPDKPSKPLWKPGKPAPFDAPALDTLRGQAGEALRRQGYFHPTFDVTVKPAAAGGTAELIVTISEVGPIALVDTIEVTGANRHKPADVLAYAGLSRGMALDTERLQEIQSKLWRSGRFWRHTLTASAVAGKPGLVRLSLVLEEHATATPLGAAWTPEEVTYLRVREALAKCLTEGAADLVFEVDTAGGRAKLVLNGKRGVVVWKRPAGKADPGGASPAARPANAAPAPGAPANAVEALLARIDGGASLLPGAIARYDLAGGSRLTFEGPAAAKTGIQAQFWVVPDTARPGESAMQIGTGFNQSPDGPAAPVAFDVQLAPVCFVDLARKQAAKAGRPAEAKMADGMLTVTIGRQVFRMRADTGELVDAVATFDAGGTGAPALDRLHMSIGPDALVREVKRLEAATSRTPPQRMTHPGLAMAAMAGEIWLDWVGVPEARRPLVDSALRKLTSDEVANAAGALVGIDDRRPPDDRFFVPVDVRELAGMTARGSMWAFLAEGVPWCDRLFERGSWPWTLAREGLLLVAGRAKYTNLETGRIYASSEPGPLGCWAIARAYQTVDPKVARLFARQGLKRLTPEDFGRDCRTLLEGGAPSARFLSALTRALRTLTPEEADALAGAVPGRWGQLLRVLAAAQRDLPADAKAVVPPGLQKALWEGGVREAVEADLEEMGK